MIANAVPRSLRHWFCGRWRRMMAFGMPEMTLSRQGCERKCRKHGQLDMLVFGMPKIGPSFFC
jgi:hypothetical protein